jgi:hypothetical protein
MKLQNVRHLYGTNKRMSRGSSVSIVTDYGLDDRGSRFDPRQRQRIFLLASASKPALGPTQPPVQWVPGVLSPGVKRGRGVTLTTRPHLVPTLRMSRSTSSPPQAPPWRVVGQLYFTIKRILSGETKIYIFINYGYARNDGLFNY